MGNYKKTVRCSWCCEHGHNKITCPKLKSYIEGCRNLHGNDDPKVQEYDATKARYSRKSSNNAAKRRYCTYCDGAGHNRRTCEWLKDHKKTLLKKNILWRKSVVSILKKEGICVGSLISYDNENYFFGDVFPTNISTKGDLWMVIRINWDAINFFESCDEAFSVSLMKRPSTKRNISLESLLYNNTDLYKSNDCVWKIISKGSTLNVPDKWLSEDMDILTKVDMFFNDLTKEAYDETFSLLADDKNQLIDGVLREAQRDEEKEKR